MAKFLSYQMDSSVTITYYFRGSDDKESATPVSLARSVLAHLLRERSVKSSPQYSRFLETIYPSSIGRDEPQKCQFERLWAIIAEVSECLESLTMIVDALDECRSCSDLDVLLSSLKDLTSRPTTRVIVFSRLHGKIETAIKDSVVIEMDATTVTTDINLYLNAMIDRSQQLKPLRSEILARAKESCDGMFQWAKMMIDSLQKARTRKMLRVKIQQFPEGLFAAYEKLVRESAMQMNKDDLQLRRHIFLLILSASRLLTPDELALALALQDSNRYLDETDEILDIREVVLQLCWPLANVSKGYVRLVHMSVRDFLVHPRSEKNDTFSKGHGLAMTFEDSNAMLARKCFNRLSLQENRNPNRIAALLRRNVYRESMTSDSEDTDLDTEKSIVFYDYAATNWHIHLTTVPEPDRGLLIQAEIFLHGREFVKWGEYLYDLKSDAGPIEEVKGILKLWYTKLPPASQDQLHIDRYFSGPYRELSMFYGEDGGDKVLPYLPLYRLGEFYLMAANPESAYKVKKVVADGLTEVLGKRHPLTLRAMSTLALDSIITSRMRDAEKTYSEISQLQLEVVGEDHPDGYESLLYVALAQYYMTKFEESASTSARSQAGLFRLLGPRHNLFLTGQLFNAYDIAELGQLEEARYMLEDIYKYRVSILGSDNAMALMAQVALGQVSRKLGDFETAEHHLEQAFEARQRIWGLTIFSSVDTAIHLIILNREMGRPKHAQRYIDIISKPGRADLYFERHCQVEHLRALLLIDNGQFKKPQEILQSILNRSSELGRESNNRALLWVRLTLATILRDNNQKDKASMLFADIVTEDYDTDDEASSLVEEPEPPKVLQIAEDALRLVRVRKYKEAEALLKENELKWVRQDDFWLQTGGPAADTAWMKGP